MFELKKQNAKVVHINIREEKHGDEEVLAADVKIAASVPNTFLEQLAPGMRDSFYKVKTDPNKEVDGMEPNVSELRYPELKPMKWDGESENADFVIHGAKASADMRFVSDVNGLQINPKDGGAVDITFRAQVLPSPEELGKLTSFLGGTAKVSVVPETTAE